MKRKRHLLIAIFLVPVFAVTVLGYASFISIQKAVTRTISISPEGTKSTLTTVTVVKNLTGATEVEAATLFFVTVLAAGSPTVTIQWAVPELRVGAAESNDDSIFYIAIFSSAEDDAAALFTMSGLATTEVDGTYSTQILLGSVTTGTYDVIFKGSQTLAKKLNDITLIAGNNVLNFSTTDNAASKGSEVLLGGDISNAGTDPSSLGDNVVNSIDFSLLLDVLDDTDSTGNNVRSNINQDTAINSVDMSILLKNLDVNGDDS